ncbi:MAG: hypothetical protein P1U32_02780 [Legionellaceae bacterium]|nr:hypothetical protein [Legionellaceae bacterium]
MPEPLKVIFVEHHFDMACYTINKMFPWLMAHGFNSFFYERGPSVTYETCYEEVQASLRNLSNGISELDPRRDAEELFYMQLTKRNFEQLSALLQKVGDSDCVYRGVDTSVREEDLGYFSGETNFSEEALARINLESSQAMAHAYMGADENTFGVMGYSHAEEAMQSIVDNHQEDEFVFVFVYNQQSEMTEEDEAFIEKANDLPMPVLCLDAKLGANSEQNIEAISETLLEKLQRSPSPR